MTLDPDAAAAYVRAEHADVVAAVETCADAVGDSWPGERVADASAVTDPLADCLETAGVLDSLPGVLAGAVAAAGGDLAAEPVAAPPYVVVTSRGPLLRATVGDDRLVVRFPVFRVTDAGRYERVVGDAPVVTATVR